MVIANRTMIGWLGCSVGNRSSYSSSVSGGGGRGGAALFTGGGGRGGAYESAIRAI